MTLANHGRADVVIVNAFVKEESADNRRFLSDVEAWLGHPITVLMNEKYGGSVREVWRRTGYIKGPTGASCALRLKREPLAKFSQPGDIPVIGFTVEEIDRMENLRDSLPLIECPLIEANLTKADCLGMLIGAGIKPPDMYELGFNNSNCIMCPKGGKGYANHVRKVFPSDFAEVAAIQRQIGPGSYFWADEKTGQRISLDDLDPNAGNHNEPEISCSFFCQMAEEDIRAGELVQIAAQRQKEGE
jgi:hypothetical protein